MCEETDTILLIQAFATALSVSGHDKTLAHKVYRVYWDNGGKEMELEKERQEREATQEDKIWANPV